MRPLLRGEARVRANKVVPRSNPPFVAFASLLFWKGGGSDVGMAESCLFGRRFAGEDQSGGNRPDGRGSGSECRCAPDFPKMAGKTATADVQLPEGRCIGGVLCRRSLGNSMNNSF